MANPKNTAELAELKEKIAESSSIVITEYRGLSVAQLQELRTNLGFDVDYSVAKNTLFKIAANEAGIEGLDEHLSGPTAFAFIKGEAVDRSEERRVGKEWRSRDGEGQRQGQENGRAAQR